MESPLVRAAPPFDRDGRGSALSTALGAALSAECSPLRLLPAERERFVCVVARRECRDSRVSFECRHQEVFIAKVQGGDEVD